MNRSRLSWCVVILLSIVTVGVTLDAPQAINKGITAVVLSATPPVYSDPFSKYGSVDYESFEILEPAERERRTRAGRAAAA